MAADDDELTPEQLAEIGEDDPESGKRARRVPPPALRALLVEFHDRAKGLSGAPLQAEVDRLIDAIVERHVGIVPASLKVEVRQRMRSMLESDPTLSEMLRGLRAAAERESR